MIFDWSPLISQGVDFIPVEGNRNYSFARVKVNGGTHTIISEGCGVIATAYGYGLMESYAYSGGASFNKINTNPIPEGGCLNDTIFFDPGLSTQRFNFFWDLGDGTTSTEATFQKIYNKLGRHPVQLILEDKCLETIDTLNRDLQVSLRQAVNVLPEIKICEKQALSLSATDLEGARYEWDGPAFFTSEEQFPVINQAETENAGQYRVIGVISGCATFPAITDVDIIPLPVPDLGMDTSICFQDYPFGLNINPGQFPVYRWDDGTIDQKMAIFQQGVYTVEVENDIGCIGRDSIEIKELCITKVYAPNAFSPNHDGINDTFRLYGRQIDKIHLQIFDRWGTKLFEAFDNKTGWNGRYNGKWMDNGAYVWIASIDGIDENGDPIMEIISGSVQLIR